MIQRTLWLIVFFTFSMHFSCDMEIKAGDSCGDGFLDPGEECDQSSMIATNCQELGYYEQFDVLKCKSDCSLDVTVCASKCGDGIVQTAFGERCDQADLLDATCDSLGLGTGTLACSDTCRLDASGCEIPIVCGDGEIRSPLEECEGSDLGGATCATVGFHSGTLVCTSECEFDTSGCVGLCGDGVLQSDFEDCEASDLNGNTCESLGHNSGILACSSTCEFDLSNCGGFCGDHLVGVEEDCDGDALGESTCETLGFVGGGDLSCSLSCTYDTTQCVAGAVCGNNVLEAGETCDGDFLGGETCMSLGFYGGVLLCDDQCSHDVTSCEIAGRCGDGVLQLDEACDLDDLNGNSCLFLGYYGGVLACDDTCAYNLSDCEVAGRCGDSILQSTESCDSGNLDGETCQSQGYPDGGTLVCNPDCTFNIDGCLGSPLCGDGTIQPEETCDGTDLGTATCRDIPLGFGVPVCNSSCQPAAGTCTDIFAFGSTESDDVKDLAVDAAGNSYLVITTRGTIDGVASNGFSSDVFVVKVSVTGELDWVNNVGTTSSEFAAGIALDSVGDVYVSGVTAGSVEGTSNGMNDAFLSKFSGAGVFQWSRQWGSSQHESVSNVAVDGYDNVYVTGYTGGAFHGNVSAGSTDAYLIKFDSSGTRQWTQQWGTHTIDYGRAVAIDASNNVFIAGQTVSSNFDGTSSGDGSYDLFVTKFSSTGVFQWSRQWGAAGVEDALSIDVHSSGFIVVSGSTDGTMPGNVSAGYIDAIVTKIDDSGSVLWTRQWGSTEQDKGNDVRTDAMGNIWITGTTQGTIDGTTPPAGMDIFLTKYSSDGVWESTTQWGTVQQDWGSALVVDANGHKFLTGSTSQQLGTYPFVRYADAFIIFVP